jgi:putative phosphoesterase
MATPLRRVGFFADTHSNKADGTDVSEQVDRAFSKVDLIVALGDIGRKGFIPRLQKIAPVWVPYGEGKGYIPFESPDDPVKVIDVGGLQLGLTFNLAQPDKKIVIEDERIVFPDTPLADLLQRRFKQPVDLVAFGGTHRQLQQVHEDVLFFNPGSPTLPSDSRGANDLGSVAVLDVTKGKAKVDLVRLASA